MARRSAAIAAPTFRRLRPARVGVMGQKVIINLGMIAAIWIVMSLLAPRFLSVENLTNIFRQIAVVGTVGSVVTLLMVSRNFDLSVGGAAALSAAIAATLADSGWEVIAAWAAGTLAGVLVGSLNGVLVLVVGINAVIATLGTMYLTQGFALLVTHGVPIYSMPAAYKLVGQGYLGPVPYPIVILLLFVVVMTVVERRTLLGMWARAAGSNPQAARLSGVPTRRVHFALFVLSGAAAGWGGIMFSSRTGGFFATVGEGFEFQVIVAAVLGGTSLLGGEGLVFGTLLGALIIGTLNNSLNLLGVPTFWQTAALGGILVLAVVLDTLLRRRARRAALRVARRAEPARTPVSQGGASAP